MLLLLVLLPLPPPPALALLTDEGEPVEVPRDTLLDQLLAQGVGEVVAVPDDDGWQTQVVVAAAAAAAAAAAVASVEASLSSVQAEHATCCALGSTNPTHQLPPTW